MTRRPSLRRWLAYALVPAVMSLGVTGIIVRSQGGVVTDAAPVAFTSKPRITTAEAPTEAATPEAPTPEAVAPDAPAETSAPEPPPNPCADALTWVSTTAGLPLPDGVDYHCPSTQFPHHGAACWGNSTYCPDRGFIAINTGLFDETDTDYLRHVVAHEVCHILDFQATGVSSEWGADACAAAHGAPA